MEKAAHQKGTAVVYVVLGVLIIALISGMVFLIKSSTSKPTSTGPKATTPQQVNSKFPPVRTGFKQYVDENFGFGFNYPESYTASKYADFPGFSIDKIDGRGEVLMPYYFSPTDPKTSLMTTDLFCAADGPGSSIRCENKKVEEFTNALGFKGYKITRAKTWTGLSPRTLNDTAYAFPLLTSKKGTGSYSKVTYTGVLFHTETINEINLSELSKIVDSYFAF